MNQPHNIEHEQILLSSLMLDPESYHEVAGMLTVDCFYKTYHQQIYRAISCLVAEEKPVTVVSVAAELQRQGIEPKRSELVTIASSSATAGNIGYYAKTVSELYARRKAIETMVTLAERAGDLTSDLVEILATAQKELDQTLPIDNRHINSNIYPRIVEVWERLLNVKTGGELSYVPTGFIDLDSMSNLTKGTLTILGAPPRLGKTSMVLCIMRNMAKSGKRPLLFTLEMTSERIMENLIAQEAQACHRDMILGLLTEREEQRITKLAGVWANADIGVLDESWSVAQIRHRVIQEIRGSGVDCVFVDGLGGLEMPRSKDLDATRKVYDAQCRALQKMAIELKIAVLLTHHLSRDKVREGIRPNLYSLNEAGEKYVDNAWLLHREYFHKPSPTNKNITELIIAKNRDGDVGTVTLGWDGPTKSFYNLAKRKEIPEVMGGAYQ